MVDALKSQPAFDASLVPGRHGLALGEPGVVARCLEDVALAVVMARKGQGTALAARVKQLHQVELPLHPRRSANGPVAWIGLAPGQWLVTGVPAEILSPELVGLASVSAQSDSRGLVRLSGPRLRATLAKGVPLDLHPQAFRSGDAAATLVSLVSIWLWMLDDAPTFELAVPRSMADSFAHWLVASASEFGLEVA